MQRFPRQNVAAFAGKAGGVRPRPIVLGAGARLFQGGYERFKLKLDSARALDAGSVLLKYRAV